MRIKAVVATVALWLAVSNPSPAVPTTYEGIITPGVVVSGLVSGNGWGINDAAGVDFWLFNGTANQSVNIRGTRLNQNLDPAFTLYFGSTTADAAQFKHDADWGGLAFLAIANDEVPAPPGPGGDPLLSSFILPFSGAYTIAIGGSNSSGAGPFGYLLQVSNAPRAVPIGNSASLLVIGFIGLWCARRRASGGSARAAARQWSFRRA